MSHDDEIITRGKVVFITYSVLSEEGQIMGQQDMPTGYVHGAGSGLFVEIEQGLEGHRVGERVEVQLTPELAFGHADPSLIFEEQMENVPPTYRRLGAEAEFQNEKGETTEPKDLPSGSDPDTKWIETILGKAENEATALNGLRVIQFTEAAWVSADTGQPSEVVFD